MFFFLENYLHCLFYTVSSYYKTKLQGALCKRDKKTYVEKKTQEINISKRSFLSHFHVKRS